MAPAIQNYFTHWNGGRPYLVQITADEYVQIFTVKFQDYDEKKHGSLNRKLHPIEEYGNKLYIRAPSAAPILVIPAAHHVWIGVSAETPMTIFSGGHGPSFDGNTILIQPVQGVNEYIHVGRSLFRFRTVAPIVSYASPMGNNDCPYPCAYDSDNNVYLLVADVVLVKCKAHPAFSTDVAKFCPYDYYYGHKNDASRSTGVAYRGYTVPNIVYVDEECVKDEDTGKYEEHYGLVSTHVPLEKNTYFEAANVPERRSRDEDIVLGKELSVTAVADLIAAFNAECGYVPLDIVQKIHTSRW